MKRLRAKNASANQLALPAFEAYVPLVRVAQPNGDVLIKAGKPIVIDKDEITIPKAATILGLSERRVREMCDEGTFREGHDWTQPHGEGGKRFLRRTSVYRVKYGTDFEAVMKAIAQENA